MSNSLRECISSVLMTQTIEEEKNIASNQLADIRTHIRNCDISEKPKLIAKMMFFHMRGENTSWGNMEIINLMNNERESYKRIGYIAASVILNDNNELITLMTHTILKDLISNVERIQIIALILLSNIISSELAQSCASSVAKCLESSNPMIQKHAGMTAVSIVRVSPEFMEIFKPYIAKIMNSMTHSVVSVGISMALELLKLSPNEGEHFAKYLSSFSKIIRNLYTSRPPQEFKFGAGLFFDPFLQIKIMKIISAIKSPSEEIDDILSTIITGVDVQRNTGRSLLLQAVDTIGRVAKKPSLISLAYNQIGRLFNFPESNIIYLALSTFSRILYSDKSMIERSSSDSVVLQRYKSNVVRCLDHRDPSIRRRALDVITALVDESNVETLIPEVLAYLQFSDIDFRSEMINKVFTSIQRFSPNPKWTFDTVLKLLIESGNYASGEVVNSSCSLISSNSPLHSYMIVSLKTSILENPEKQPLVQIAAWAIGEFIEQYDIEIINMFKVILMLPQTIVETKCFIITAVSKIGVRFHNENEILPILFELSKNCDLEIQQRSGEMFRILNSPMLSEQLMLTSPQDIQEPEVVESKVEIQSKSIVEENRIVPPPGSILVQKTSDFEIYFECKRNDTNPNQIAIRSSVFNLGSVPLSNFSVQYGVPTGWGIVVKQPSSNVLEPIGGKPIQQVLFLENQAQGTFAMRTQITYMYRSQPLKEMGQIGNIFQ